MLKTRFLLPLTAAVTLALAVPAIAQTTQAPAAPAAPAGQSTQAPAGQDQSTMAPAEHKKMAKHRKPVHHRKMARHKKAKAAAPAAGGDTTQQPAQQ